MHHVSLIIAALLFWTIPLATAGELWRPAGPERGHVVDTASTVDHVYIVTRVGVMRADPELKRWERDPRFPKDTALVRTGSDGSVWATARGCIWKVDGPKNAPTTSVWSCFSGQAVVRDLIPRTNDVIALVRGESSGIYAVAKGTKTPIQADVDPWVGLRDGKYIWIGTLGQGVWRLPLEGDRPKQIEKTTTITGLGLVNGDIWAGDKDGRLYNVENNKTVGDVSPGWATHIIEHKDEAMLFAEGHRQLSGWYVGSKNALQPVTVAGVDQDSGRVDGTGVWQLPNGSALLGTFRRGPVIYDRGQLTLARTNFRATVTGGAALDSEGFLMLGLMGTGVYRLDPNDVDTISSEHGQGGPVTDTVYIGSAAEGALAIDFSGITWRKPSGRWTRLPRPPDSQMVRIAGDTSGQFWGLGLDKTLYRYASPKWTKCTTTGVISLGGPPDGLVVQTQNGLMRPERCSEPEPTIGPESTGTLHPNESVAGGDWLAARSGIWWKDQRIAAADREGFSAILPMGDRALIAAKHQLYNCTREGCASIGPKTPTNIAAAGLLKSGQPWVVEEKGTLLILGGTDEVLSPWTNVRDHAASHSGPQDPSQVTKLRRVPWSQEGVMNDGGGDPRQAKQPPPGQPMTHGQSQSAPQSPQNPPATSAEEDGQAPIQKPHRWLLAFIGGLFGMIAAWVWTVRRQKRKAS